MQAYASQEVLVGEKLVRKLEGPLFRPVRGNRAGQPDAGLEWRLGGDVLGMVSGVRCLPPADKQHDPRNQTRARIGSNQAIAPDVAPLTEFAKEPHGGMAAGIPTLQQQDFVRVQETVAAVTPLFASRKRGGPEIALHRAQTHPDVLGNGAGRPALAVQGPDLKASSSSGECCLSNVEMLPTD